MEIVGFALAALVGISLGLMGAGGSILTVPILVYVMKLDAVVATGYSLFIVGSASLVGAIRSYTQKMVSIKTAFLFGLPSIITAYLVRAFLIPLMPKEVISIGNFVITKSVLLLLIFAIVMIIASYKMIKPSAINLNNETKFNLLLLLLNGSIVGILTGLVGAGGGFLIIPALALMFQMPMNKAVGTSLLIITMNTLFSFFGSIKTIQPDWLFLIKFSLFAIIGIFIGIALSKKISEQKLKPIFGWFVLLMGIYILVKEIFIK